MNNLLILLGSRYQKIHEYNLPKGISELYPDESVRWIVYSIDRIPHPVSPSEEKEDGNIRIIHLQMSVELIPPEIFGINYNTVYIMDSISCGFVTDTSLKLINYFLKNNLRTYWIHYISPYNDYPTIPLSKYDLDDINILFQLIFKPLPEKAYKQLYESFKIFENIIQFILYYKHLLKDSLDNALDFAKYYLSILDLNYMEFILIDEKNIDDLYKMNISCGEVDLLQIEP